MKDHDVYMRAAQEWRNRGVPLLLAAAESEVVRTFADLDYPLSSDVRNLYTNVGGFVDYEMDRLWSLWSLGRLRAEGGGKRRPFVMFADWLISSHLYCFHFEGVEISSVYISHDGWSLEPEPVARSVAAFLEKLMNHPNEVEAWNFDA